MYLFLHKTCDLALFFNALVSIICNIIVFVSEFSSYSVKVLVDFSKVKTLKEGCFLVC